MKETGIIMSGDHPRKILDGLKTMTRRTWGLEEVNKDPDNWFPGVLRVDGAWSFLSKDLKTEQVIKCPYGQVGDLLWVKETWKAGLREDGAYLTEYKAGGFKLGLCDPVAHRFAHYECKWQPSIHMFRWASRIDRTITGLRAERLQAITEDDARAEGMTRCYLDTYADVITKFKKLWDSINAKRGYSWDFNPWAWPISFKEVKEK